MFAFFSIVCIYAIIIKSYGNPVFNNNNVTDVDNSDSEHRLLCDRNVRLISNYSLFELLNNNRYWFVLARSKFIYGEQTWNNVLMQTSTTVNGTTYLEFIGKNSNDSCVNSEKGEIISDTKSNRVFVHWPNEEGFLEMIFIDETMIHFILCYSMDSNKTDICAHNQSEQFVVQNNKQEFKNDTISWLESHCSSVNSDDFIVNDNPKTCVPVVLQSEIVEVNTTEQSVENMNTTNFQTTYPEVNEQVNVTDTLVLEFNSTTRTNRTNRLEVLEEYYSNSTNGNQLEQITPVEIEEIVVLSTNASSTEESNRTNVTIVEETVIEPVANGTVNEEVPLFVLHKAIMNETATTEVLPDNAKTTENAFTQSSEGNDSTEVNINITTPINLSTVSVNSPTTEKQVLNQSTVSVTPPATKKQALNKSAVSVTSPTTTKQVLNESTVSVTPPATKKQALNESAVSVTSPTTTKQVLNESTVSVTPPATKKQVLNESTVSVTSPTTTKQVSSESTVSVVPLTTKKQVFNESTVSVTSPTTMKQVSSESTVSVTPPTTMKQVFNESTVSVAPPTTMKQVLNESTISVTSPTTMKQVFNESTVSTAPPTTMKQVLNESTISVNVEDTTVVVTTEYESTTMIETTVELTTTEVTTSTSVVPADCPTLKDCPFDYCAFARKLDNRGCPTCNCLQSNKSNIVCPALTCQACLYGHYTDPNGCPICQCQSRPYPPLGERCPQLNCEPCYFGTVKDEYNCDTCVCIRPNNQECPVLDCTFGPCKYGSIKDEDDCPTCDCLLPTINATEVNCSTSISCPSCHLGYVKDADGCETCQCKLRGSVPCASISSECQCEYGSYLNSDGCETCSCLPDPKNASQQACWELLNQANFHNISGPVCSSDGLFYARQCDKSKSNCWCVTPTGIHISGFESRVEENVNCACAVELYQVSSLRMIGHHLLCLLNGNYAPVQCDGRYCSCVDENGKPIGPSVSIQNRDQLRCVGVYQQLHPERFLLHRATIEQTDGSRFPYGISSSLCLTHLEQVRNANITDDHILIPVCDANGLYAPVQCDQSERYCWCVDKKTGVEMDGTRRLNARPNCNIV